jgi:hypothetical protein
MKKILTAVFAVMISLLTVTAAAQSASDTTSPDKNKELMEVEAACGQCQFDLPGSGCNLAVRIKGKAYFVDGTAIDDHGDAHAKDGFCNAVRKARVQGTVKDNRFKASYFKLVAGTPAQESHH